MNEWLYLRLYPGSLEKLDFLISAAVRPAVELSQRFPDIDRWFFIRYIDYLGPHLRLRFRGPVDGISRMYNPLIELVQTNLEAAGAIPQPSVRRLVPVPLQAGADGHVGYQLDMYEPEYAKYGGPVGVEIAEAVFDASSKLVLWVYEQGIPSLSDRANLALVLMRLAAGTFLPTIDHMSFWTYYSWYWSGGSTGHGEALRRRFRAAAVRGAQQTTTQCRLFLEENGVRQEVDRYGMELAKARSAYQTAAVAVPNKELCFHFVHMMNNRLGIYPVEEAYLAQLVGSLSD